MHSLSQTCTLSSHQGFCTIRRQSSVVRLVGHRDDRFECRRLVFSLSFLCESEERLGILEVEEMRRALTPGLPERWE